MKILSDKQEINPDIAKLFDFDLIENLEDIHKAKGVEDMMEEFYDIMDRFKLLCSGKGLLKTD